MSKMNPSIKYQVFSIMFLGLVISWLGYVYPVWNLPMLIVVGLGTLAASLKRPEWGVYILFGELFLGSRGRMLEYDFVSLRMVIFGAVLAAWIITQIQNSKFKNQNLNAKYKIYWVLLIVIALQVLHGLVAGNGLRNVFLDANGYLYLLILPVVLSAVRSREQVEKLLKILGTAIIVTALLGLLLFVWFAFDLPGVAILYQWILNREMGEITGLTGSASRIFLQSQFWALLGVFIFAFREKKKWPVLIAAVFSLILSLSRSFWLGGIAGAVFVGVMGISGKLGGLGRLGKLAGIILLFALLEVAALFGLAKLGGGVSESVLSRSVNPVQEAAGSARLLLLPELLKEIKESPIIGKGFGEEVTYKSFLPDRITPENPDGEIKSFAFEWGYLDMALKLGILGTLVYLLFIAKIFSEGFKFQIPNSKIQNLGILAGVVALVVLNITTPYLNHPLGIGYLVLVYVSFQISTATTPSQSPPHEGEKKWGFL